MPHAGPSEASQARDWSRGRALMKGRITLQGLAGRAPAAVLNLSEARRRAKAKPLTAPQRVQPPKGADFLAVCRS